MTMTTTCRVACTARDPHDPDPYTASETWSLTWRVGSGMADLENSRYGEWDRVEILPEWNVDSLAQTEAGLRGILHREVRRIVPDCEIT